jgi:hypothetical protein
MGNGCEGRFSADRELESEAGEIFVAWDELAGGAKVPGPLDLSEIGWHAIQMTAEYDLYVGSPDSMNLNAKISRSHKVTRVRRTRKGRWMLGNAART